jgi:hypothetical protein
MCDRCYWPGFAALGDRLAAVDVEGQQANVLSGHADELASVSANRSLRPLGAFDEYVLGPGRRADLRGMGAVRDPDAVGA